jgi:hypothetical protein
MKPVSAMSVGELAAYVAEHLRSLGFDVLLSGGACVTLYSRGEYVSMDLDFVPMGLAARRRLREALADIGFTEKGRCFVHPETDFFLDFPAGPPAVGRQPVRETRTMEFSTGTLRLLSPTDCVKDRLANYYYFGDRQCLHQAVLVIQAQDVDLDDVEHWSVAEGRQEAFEAIEDNLRRAAEDGKKA